MKSIMNCDFQYDTLITRYINESYLYQGFCDLNDKVLTYILISY